MYIAEPEKMAIFVPTKPTQLVLKNILWGRAVGSSSGS